MQETLATTVASLNRVKRASTLSGFVLRTARAAALSIMTVSVWALVRPQEELEQLALGGLAFLVALVAGMRGGADRRIETGPFALALEMRHGKERARSLTALEPDAPLPEEWADDVRDFRKELVRFETMRNVALATSLVLPLAVTSVTLPQAVPSFKLALSEVGNVVGMLNRGATLRIVQGATAEVPEKGYPLSADEPVAVELLAQNLVEVNVTGGGFGKTAPVVELRRIVKAAPPPDAPASAEPETASDAAPSAAGDAAETATDAATSTAADTTEAAREATADAKPSLFQRFQMIPVRDPSRPPGEDETSRYSISFAVAEPVELFIPQLEGDKPLARLQVRQLPIPKVKLVSLSDPEDPWPDDQPLNLRIDVEAENPLQLVRLLIKSGARTSKELVANVMAEDRTELTTEYRLVLETYVESDLAEVEIVAEAIDRAVPTPLAGYSEPLRLKTASAYGRYRATLQTLRELKQDVDETLGKKDGALPQEALERARKASEQSEKSPFFDGLDRVQIHRFETKAEEIASESGGMEAMLDLSQQLNDFLFEHEILDDRERDRDFFVATRSLSRIVEQEPSKRPVELKTVTERMKKFLDDREQRWERRVERLAGEHRPPQWDQMRAEKPFQETMKRIEALETQAKTNPKARSDQLTELSKAVVDYRAWIEDLEAREDKMREQEERERQEGLASARNTLRELQQRQGEVSSELDRAAERPKDQLEQQWASTRMKQNANSKETKRLEGQMRALSPNAGARIEAAHEAMEGALKAGNEGDYQLAESSSDMAGRLLRQAERAASQSQQKRRSRGRRRRVTGDNYYGQSVVGGDIEIKREYQVDRRYREDILDEVQGATLDEDQRVLMENYLRQIIR